MAPQAARIDTPHTTHNLVTISRRRPGVRAFAGSRPAISPGQASRSPPSISVAVLILGRQLPPHLVRQQPAILLIPVGIGRSADPRLATDLSYGSSLLSMFQDERLLRHRELRCIDAITLPARPRKSSENSSFKRSSFQGADHRKPMCSPTTVGIRVSCGEVGRWIRRT